MPQAIRRPLDPSMREKSPQQLERERIYANYDKSHPKEVVIDDPDDPRYYMDSDEMREFERKKLAAEPAGTFPDRMKAKREEIYAKTAPEPEEVEPDYDDGRPVVYRALDRFIEKNPEYASDSKFKELTRTAVNSMHPDIFRLRTKFNQTEDRADGEALLTRSAEIGPGETKLAADRAAAEAMQRRRMETKGPV